ncbi:hypothetical protein [Rhizobium sp. 21-4511-3d]
MNNEDVSMKTNPIGVFDAVRSRREAIIEMMGGRPELSALPPHALVDTLTVIAFDNVCAGTLSDVHLHGPDIRPQKLWDAVTAQITRAQVFAEDDRLDLINDALGRGHDLASGTISIREAWFQG